MKIWSLKNHLVVNSEKYGNNMYDVANKFLLLLIYFICLKGLDLLCLVIIIIINQMVIMVTFIDIFYLSQIWYPLFKHNNRLESQNQVHKYLVSLQKTWITTNTYFKIITALFVIIFTRQAYHYNLAPGSKDKDLSTKTFANPMDKYLLNNNKYNILNIDVYVLTLF